jgi:tRNA threonylcarbamoyladenosine biosynthesis protein TsaE
VSTSPTSTLTGNLTEQINKESVYDVHCSDEAATVTLVKSLARAISESIVSQRSQNPTRAHLHISLQGDLGSGKTTAVRYLLKELGYTGKVKSPTYSLCEPHLLQINQHPIQLYHFDFYRMQSSSEWIETGLQEHFSSHESTICIVEWPEKAGNTLPTMDLSVGIKASNQTDHSSEYERLIAFHANTSIGQELLNHLVSKPITLN